jgi:hypothetical protein
MQLSPRLKTALIAAALATVATFAIVTSLPFLFHICLPMMSRRIGQVWCIPVYWFYIAAGVGSFLASRIAFPTGEARTKSSFMLFIFLCDVFSMWIGGAVVLVGPAVLNDFSFGQKNLPSEIFGWMVAPVNSLLMGMLFGNPRTLGYGFLIGLPTVAWLMASRRFASRAAGVND